MAIITKEQILNGTNENYKRAYEKIMSGASPALAIAKREALTLKAERLEHESKLTQLRIERLDRIREQACVLSNLRAKTGLTAEEFCKKFGFKLNEYVKWESGNSDFPGHVISLVSMMLAYEFANDTILPYRRYKKPVTVIRKMIEHSGLKKFQFADKYGIRRGTISSWVSGRVLPKFYILSMLENIMYYEMEFGNVSQYMSVLN